MTASNPGWVALGDPGVSPYTFLDVANKFTVVGCDDLALISGTFGGKTLNSGCTSLCFDRSDVGDRTGYCQTDIPKGLTYYNISLVSVFNHTGEEVIPALVILITMATENLALRRPQNSQ
ncbi:hypothetical protein Vadar_004271 [Vaccinium darrowii]|uniref:Uncharacterized protein n=1 Tax=Vaccinium darrowii TaxID=229202 RepID=A0ACB7XN46_9ERIC|nr:hypothetical protein Vadar_004271 [Vaccinium darrowii]